MRPDARAHPYKHASLIVYTFSAEEYTTVLYKLPGTILPHHDPNISIVFIWSSFSIIYLLESYSYEESELS